MPQDPPGDGGGRGEECLAFSFETAGPVTQIQISGGQRDETRKVKYLRETVCSLESYLFFLLSLSLPSPCSGQRHQRLDEQETGAARALHGGDHGDLLLAVLAAVRHHGSGGHVRTSGPGDARGQHHPLRLGQDQHGHQSCHLRLHE